VIAARLDQWLPDPIVRTRHERIAGVQPERLWHAARSVRVAEARALAPVLRWRIPGTSAEQTFEQLLTRYPFRELERGDTWSLSGLCGRIWTLRRDYPHLSGPEDFLAWNQPGTVRVLFAHWVEPRPGGHSALLSEARVAAVDRRAALRMRSLWLVVSRFERLIGAEPLSLAVQHAARDQVPARPCSSPARRETPS
jgi:hypothetical protein